MQGDEATAILLDNDDNPSRGYTAPLRRERTESISL